jgi:DNA-binding transcriptional MerR regulator
VDDLWTLADLVAIAAERVTALPLPKNGQVRAVPDDRTVRYYAAIGLLDRPVAMRGRTAFYGKRHLAQIVAIKRLQGVGRSLAEIRQLWPTLDDGQLERMSGVAIGAAAKPLRKDFWKRDPYMPESPAIPSPLAGMAPPEAPPQLPLELRVELATGASLVLALPVDSHLSISPADVRALRAAAEPLVAELAARGLVTAPQP